MTTEPGRAQVRSIIVPAGWDIIEERLDGIAAERRGLHVIASVAIEEDGNAWLHVSVSGRGRMAQWEELRTVKEQWVGDHREAYQVFPTADRYVNINPHVLHIWARHDDGDGRVLPRFDRGGGSI